MIGFLHGYHLEGSGSNLWTQYMVRAFCHRGLDVHLVCQENHPQKFDFITEALVYDHTGPKITMAKRSSPYPGKCILHRIEFEDFIPVYVGDFKGHSSPYISMINLSDEELKKFLDFNQKVFNLIFKTNPVQVIHANHLVLMPQLAQGVKKSLGTPFVMVAHGSALEYTVKKDPRFCKMAKESMEEAEIIFNLSHEMKGRLKETFPTLGDLDHKIKYLPLGVNTELFHPIKTSERPKHIHKLLEHLEPQRVKELKPKLDKVNWEKDKILLFVGPLIENKGVAFLIEALPEILQRIPNLRCLVVGRGPLKEVLEEKSHVLGDRVIFLGYLDHLLLRWVYPCGDVGVFPSLIPEAGPLVFLEAMAAGVFPMGTDMGGMAQHMDLIRQYLPKDSAAAMRLPTDQGSLKAALIQQIPQAMSMAGKFSRLLSKVAREHYDWNQVVEDWISGG